MESNVKNNMPVSVIAATGVCSVLPAAHHIGAATPAVATSLAARIFPQVDQAQNLIIPTGSYLVQEKPSTKLGGFRGVPPRGRPV